MLQIAICDDMAPHRAYAARIIQKYPPCAEAAQRLFSRPQEMLEALAGGYLPDIAVLDIQMEDMDGIALGQQINALAPSCQIIFLSAYLEYAPDVYAAEHVYFVLKTQSQDRLAVALDKCMERLLSAESHSIVISSNGQSRRLDIAEISYMERVLHKTRIVAHGEELWATPSPKELLKPLKGNHFLQCHRSYYVNMEQVDAFFPNAFLLRDGCRVPISRSHRKAAKGAFLFRR